MGAINSVDDSLEMETNCENARRKKGTVEQNCENARRAKSNKFIHFQESSKNMKIC